MKTTENYRNQLKILQETINTDLQNVRLYKKCFSMVTIFVLKFLPEIAGVFKHPKHPIVTALTMTL